MGDTRAYGFMSGRTKVGAHMKVERGVTRLKKISPRITPGVYLASAQERLQYLRAGGQGSDTPPLRSPASGPARAPLARRTGRDQPCDEPNAAQRQQEQRSARDGTPTVRRGAVQRNQTHTRSATRCSSCSMCWHTCHIRVYVGLGSLDYAVNAWAWRGHGGWRS